MKGAKVQKGALKRRNVRVPLTDSQSINQESYGDKKAILSRKRKLEIDSSDFKVTYLIHTLYIQNHQFIYS